MNALVALLVVLGPPAVIVGLAGCCLLKGRRGLGIATLVLLVTGYAVLVGALLFFRSPIAADDCSPDGPCVPLGVGLGILVLTLLTVPTTFVLGLITGIVGAVQPARPGSTWSRRSQPTPTPTEQPGAWQEPHRGP